jgi:uncharacterized membrane protein HdeD (DUF308 family)
MPISETPQRSGRNGGQVGWLRLILGLLCVLVGGYLTLSPFASLAVLVVLVVGALAVTGVTELVAARRSTAGAPAYLGAATWLVAALAVALWPGITIGVLAVLVGVALVVTGVLRLVAGVPGATEERFTAVVAGVAGVVPGGWPWPGPTSRSSSSPSSSACGRCGSGWSPCGRPCEGGPGSRTTERPRPGASVAGPASGGQSSPWRWR